MNSTHIKKHIINKLSGFKRMTFSGRGFIFLIAFLSLFHNNSVNAQQPFVGQIRIFAGNFAPQGWVFCDGQLLSIADNATLFNLIGTTYGGDGQTTFAVPDLRGRLPIDRGQGPSTSSYILGQSGGVETVTLTTQQIPSHTHTAAAFSYSGSADKPSNTIPALYPDGIPVNGINISGTMNPAAIGNAGGSQPHNNVKPYLAVRYIISLFGIFPSAN